MQNGLVFKDNRIVLPTSVRKDIIATVHRSHQGIQGQHYLLLVDYYSNFFELARLGSNTRAMCVIDAIRSQFARHGSPEVLVSDNGLQFACREFRTFTQLWDIEHVTSSPRYPQSNGQAERAIGTVKNLMKKALRRPVGIAEL